MRALQWCGRVGVLLAVAVACVVGANGAERAAETPKFSYAPYADVLSKYVDNEGLVNYKELKANRAALDRFTRALADLDPAAYDKWTDKEKIAFWINAYNALTLQVVVDHFPIKAGLIASIAYPKNSIRQIPGVWDKITFPVMGKPMTLEDIEHGTLRKKFAEPRIHFALVCAAIGCPRLRGEPYAGDKLDEQFADQTRSFVQTHTKFHVNPERNLVHLSPIFKWFGEDFVANYGTSMKYTGHEASERAVLNYVSKYLSEQDQQYLEQGDYEIKYLDYDWSLNGQASKAKP
jgi:hypothetical protein